MTQTMTVRTSAETASCDPRVGITKSLLGWGVVAGPLYVLVGAVQMLTRDGYDITRQPASLLANGDLGWIHVTNLILAGLLTVAGAIGMRRALPPGRGQTWGPRLVGVYGAGQIAAGVFRADPSFGFPPGTAAGPGALSWHGILHYVTAEIGFLALVAACFVFARRFAAAGERRWAAYSRATGVVFLAALVGIAAGAANAAVILAFTAAVVIAYTWVSLVSARLYREA
jgi:hypothetical protein